ncbi:hypothetical protein BSL78_27361, partial [Apostichopus japonicus]
MTRVRRKKYHYGDTHIRKKYKTKRRTKYMDEIHDDMKPENAEKMLHQDVDLDKPGSAQHYCLHCA